MKIKMKTSHWGRILATGLILGLLGATSSAWGFSKPPTWPERYAQDNEDNIRDPQGGWQVLQDDYRDFNFYDGLSFEWDYYTIHDDNDHFTGIIGYLVMDPEGHLGGGTHFWTPNLMPSGGNLAIYGRLKDYSGEYTMQVNFNSFGLDNTEASADTRYWFAVDGEGRWGRLEPEGQGMRLEGQTDDFAWNLYIEQAFGHNDSPNYDLLDETWQIGNDLDSLPGTGEHWTVNPLWLTTYVDGTITNKNNGEIYPIDGHGYRENSFGRWAFITGGWDFWFMSDMDAEVGFSLQTYHFGSEDLDFMDLTFTDNGSPQAIRFLAEEDELGWEHSKWYWDTEARQAVPLDVLTVGKNDDYTVEVRGTIERDENGDTVNDFIPMLSDATPVTNLYVIQSMFPYYEGVIYRNHPNGSTNYNDVVTTFSGTGGGEFSMARSVFDDIPIGLVDNWLTNTFRKPLP